MSLRTGRNLMSDQPKKSEVEVVAFFDAIKRVFGGSITARDILDLGQEEGLKFARECAESIGCVLYSDATFEQIAADRIRRDKLAQIASTGE